jgi:transposase
MKDTSNPLPADVDSLQQMLVAMHCENRLLHSENRVLQEEIQILKHRLFGRKSEQLTEEQRRQLYLFNEAEAQGEEPAVEPEPTVVTAHTRTKKRGRKPLPEHLPRVEIVHDIPEADKHCSCGATKSRIGEETSERLDIIPARIQVIRDIRPQYACRCCEGVEDEGPTVAIAPPPAYLIPKGIATAGLLAHVLTAKFADALPFYRQAKQFERIGVELSRTTLCGWALQVAERCGPVLDLLGQQVRAGPVVRCDETTVQVLDEPDRPATSKSYMWVFHGGPPGRPAVEYRYHPTRAGQVAADYLATYQGCVQTDGFSGYGFLDTQPGVTHVGCWAHARRKFVEAAKVAKTKGGSAGVAVATIGKLYTIEQRAKAEDLSPEALVQVRRERARPILDDFKTWLDRRATQLAPKSLLGRAVHYTLGQWDRLVAYLDHPFLTPDNNLAENAIRPFVVGRKNWLFSGTPEGAAASAAIYSLIETAKANGLDPFRYLSHLFERVPHATTTHHYRSLLPQYLSPALITQLAPGGKGGS